MRNNIKLVLLLVISLFVRTFPFGGEVDITFAHPTSNLKFNVSVSTSEYAWSKDASGNVVFVPSYNFTETGLTILTFDAPDDNSENGGGVMPWGLMHFIIEVTNNSGNVLYTSGIVIDFRDSRWSTGYGSSIDTYILIDTTTYDMYLSQDGGIDVNGPDIVLGGQTINIWDFWNKGTPFTNQFKVPVTLSTYKVNSLLLGKILGEEKNSNRKKGIIKPKCLLRVGDKLMLGFILNLL